jgi:hypothetical protein
MLDSDPNWVPEPEPYGNALRFRLRTVRQKVSTVTTGITPKVIKAKISFFDFPNNQSQCCKNSNITMKMKAKQRKNSLLKYFENRYLFPIGI